MFYFYVIFTCQYIMSIGIFVVKIKILAAKDTANNMIYATCRHLLHEVAC